MICENCGINEANVTYTQIINGVKKEMILCNKCSKELGIGEIDLSMPINLSNFLGDFFESEEDRILSNFERIKQTNCDKCGMTYDEFINTGKFGCANCYDTFKDRINPILKNLQGSNKHIGRKTKITKTQLNKFDIQSEEKKEESKVDKIEMLKENLKQAIQEERYEDAASIRDKIKELEK